MSTLRFYCYFFILYLFYVNSNKELSTYEELRQDCAEYWSWLFSRSPTDIHDPAHEWIADSPLPITHHKEEMIRITWGLPSRPGRRAYLGALRVQPQPPLHCCHKRFSVFKTTNKFNGSPGLNPKPTNFLLVTLRLMLNDNISRPNAS